MVGAGPHVDGLAERARRAELDTRTCVSQVSRRPSAARICGPVIVREPRVPITRARTTRGDAPRLSTLRRLNLPGAPGRG